MKIFLDTANLDNIKYWDKKGIIDGITTNPTLLSKEGGNINKLLKEICSIVSYGDVSIETTETDPEKVYTQAKEIANMANNVIVKIPCHKNYYAIIKKLIKEDIKINVTLVFTLIQGLMMCKLGVQYISPFIGRWDDIDVNGIKTIQELRIMIDEYNFKNTQIIAASIRHLRHFHDAILLGADVATVPTSVIEKATNHPLTDQGIEKFLYDWKKLGIKQFP